MKKLAVLAAGAASLALAPAASAAVLIEASPSFVQPDENVLLDTDILPGDNILRGTTNQTSSTVLFQSSTDNVASSPQGQAEITAIGMNSSDGLGSLTFSFENDSTFTSAEFNILAAVGGMVTLTAFDSMDMILNSIGPTIDTSGQNFFGFLAESSTPISSIQITSTGGTQISSIGQFRVGGVTAATNTPVQTAAVPEPSTWAMMLIGFGAVGFGLRRRKGAAGGRRVRVAYA